MPANGDHAVPPRARGGGRVSGDWGLARPWPGTRPTTANERTGCGIGPETAYSSRPEVSVRSRSRCMRPTRLLDTAAGARCVVDGCAFVAQLACRKLIRGSRSQYCLRAGIGWVTCACRSGTSVRRSRAVGLGRQAEWQLRQHPQGRRAAQQERLRSRRSLPIEGDPETVADHRPSW